MAYTPQFKIEESGAILKVQTVPPSPSTSLVAILVFTVFGAFYLVAAPSRDWTSRSIALACIVCIFLFQFVRSFFPSGQSLQCNSEMLTIGKISELNFSGKWTYQSVPITEIKQVQFTVIAYRRYGGGTGLKIDATDHAYKIFEGLQAPEANKILESLASHHVPILRDPAMPMMIEMVMSRRNSKFNWFWGS